MIPLIALVGRPNVGKSTLFNRLTRSRQALVDDTPGLTRDRQYGQATLEARRFHVVDTGGFLADPGETMADLIREQALLAVEEADGILLVTSVVDGPMPDDLFIAELLRRSGKPVVCVVNKCEGQTREMAALAFHELGLAEVIPISAVHGLGMDELMAGLLRVMDVPETPDQEERPVADAVRVAVVGTPNVGKSSLLNRLLGSDRLVTSEIPGTTRDAIPLPYTDRQGRPFLLVDTAGIRRKSRLSLRIEKFSVIAALKAMEQAQVAILVLDALRGIATQEQRIASYALEAGCGLVLAVNKWDQVVAEQALAARKYHQAVAEAFPRFAHAPLVFVSATTGLRIHQLPAAALQVWESHQRRVATGPLNRWLEETLARQSPPRVAGGRQLKFRYATQVAAGPPAVALFTNFPEAVPEGYQRYLENQLRETFQLQGTPIRLFFRASHDDRYAGK